MKILFLARRYTYFRNFDSVIRELASRGHVLHLAVEREAAEGRSLVAGLAAEFPAITFGEAPARVRDDWTWVVSRLRHGLEHLRYQHPMFADTPKLRERSRERTPGAFVTLGTWIRRYAPWLRRPAAALAHWFERAVPEDSAIRAYVESQAPDVVLITPLVGLGSWQIDYLRTARSLGIPSGLGVWSWDHLSSKALIRDAPDRVFVWNETQKQEAMRLHGVAEDRVVVTGAQCFDRWFDRQPSSDRETFCRKVGLPVDRPFILYVCSAPFIGSQPEAPFVADWVRRVRASAAPALRDTPILVRPHPSRREEWSAIDLAQFQDVTLWGSAPIDAGARADYFDSLYHSVAVVGLNTSAFIEAGIVGRPVLTILLPEWHENQLGTAHFRYLFDVGGGLLTSARTFEEHLRQLDAAVAHPPTEVRPFIRSFVRPLGLDVPATPLFVRHVQSMEHMAVHPAVPVPFESLARRLLTRAMLWRDRDGWEQWVYAERELDTVLRYREMRRAKAAGEAERKMIRRAERDAREAAREAELQARAAARQARDAARQARAAAREARAAARQGRGRASGARAGSAQR